MYDNSPRPNKTQCGSVLSRISSNDIAKQLFHQQLNSIVDHFATLATEDHIPGVLALAQSLYENSGFGSNIHLHILAPKSISSTSHANISKLPIETSIYDQNWCIEYNCSNKYIPRSKLVNQYKFNTFRLPVDKVTFLDSDILCLGNVEEIRHMVDITVVMNIGEEFTYNNRPMFNSGFFVCEPSVKKFKELQKYGSEWTKNITKGDQPILNKFYFDNYPDEVNYLSFNWNTIQTWRFKNRRLWNLAYKKGIKFLHYTHVKPWLNYSPSGINELYYIWEKLPKKYILYRELQSWWWPYYKRAIKQ